MLFYPQKEQLKDRKLRYKIILACILLHIIIFLISFCVSKIKNSSSTIKINIHPVTQSTQVSFQEIHNPPIRNILKNFGNIQNAQKKNVTANASATSAQSSSTTSGNTKKAIIASNISQKNTKKNITEKKLVNKSPKILKTQKKIASKTKTPKTLETKKNKSILKPDKKTQEIKEPEIIKPKEIEIKANNLIKQQESKQESKQASKSIQNFEQPTTEIGQPNTSDLEPTNLENKAECLNINIETNGPEIILNSTDNMLDNTHVDAIKLSNEIKKNIKIPTGFTLDSPIKITAQIDDTGTIKSISERQNEPIALYMAIKKGLIKSKYPQSKWGSKLEILIQ